MSKIVFDAPARWQRPGLQLAAAALAALVAVAVWWAVFTPVDREPVALHTTASQPQVTRAVPAPADTVAPAAAPLVAAPNKAASSPTLAPRPLSSLSAPGVHITPLSVPPGTVPLPAGPSERDSEPEN
jgi:hypothetical protein